MSAAGGGPNAFLHVGSRISNCHCQIYVEILNRLRSRQTIKHIARGNRQLVRPLKMPLRKLGVARRMRCGYPMRLKLKEAGMH